MDSVTSGQLIINGEDIGQFNKLQLTNYRRSHVGLVFQFYNLMPNLTDKENVEIAAELSKDSLDPENMLSSVGLEDKLDFFPAQLSGGEQQRVCVARALINHPELILADEPTGNLDEANENIVLDLFAQLHKEGTTLIVVTHDPEVAEAAQRTIVLEHGKVAREVVNENFGK